MDYMATIADKKLTQDQANQLMAPMELDFTALFKIMEDDILQITENFEGTPEELIDEIMSLIEEPVDEVVAKDLKSGLYIVMNQYVSTLQGR